MLTYAYVGLCYVHYTHVSYPCQVKNEDRAKKERLLPIMLPLFIPFHYQKIFKVP